MSEKKALPVERRRGGKRLFAGTPSQLAAFLKKLGPEWSEGPSAMHFGGNRWMFTVVRNPAAATEDGT